MVTVGNQGSSGEVYRWSQLQSLSSDDILPALSGHTMVYSEIPAPCAYVFGGWDGNRLLSNDLWMWKIEQQEWQRLRKPEELAD